MIVIFEGCDKAGKTTLKNDVVLGLKDVFGDRVLEYKAVKKPTGKEDKMMPLIQYSAVFDMAKQNPGKIFIFDRSYLSELVYSGVKRDYDVLFDPMYDKLLGAEDVLVVYVDADEATLKTRFKEDGEEYLDPVDVEAILDRYEQVLDGFEERGSNVDLLRISTPSDREANAIAVVDRVNRMMA